MNLSDALVSVGGALIGALVGGGLTGYFTLKATDKAIRAENEKENQRNEQEVDNLLAALSVELNTLWSFHMRRIGTRVEELPDGQPLEFYYPLTQDYFTIYNSNAALIGRIKDCDVSEAIVVCYNKCKKAVDAYKYNNELYRDYQEAALLEKNNARNDTLRATRYQALADFAKVIKEDHFELKGYVENLLTMLRNRT